MIDNNKVQLDWQTASEENNKGFEIERSSDGRNWELLDFINGNGSSNSKNEYQYFDEKTFLGSNYYRLKQIDFDGIFDYSETIVVLIEQSNDKIQIVPNPTSGTVYLKELRQDVLVKIYDEAGLVLEIQSENGQLDLHKLPVGSYFLSFYVGQDHITRRLIKLLQ